MRDSVVKRGNTWSYVVDVGRDPVSGRRRQRWKGGFATKRLPAGALMGLGVWLYISEHHEHRHAHERHCRQVVRRTHTAYSATPAASGVAASISARCWRSCTTGCRKAGKNRCGYESISPGTP